jgi:hypothetical protein
MLRAIALNASGLKAADWNIVASVPARARVSEQVPVPETSELVAVLLPVPIVNVPATL